MSRNGLISLSLMYCQMIRVISSPSSSTTGLVTLIFAMGDRAFLEIARFGWGGRLHPRYSTARALAKVEALCTFSPVFGSERRLCGGARDHVPCYENPAYQRPRQARAGAPPGEGGDDRRDRHQRHELDGEDGAKR